MSTVAAARYLGTTGRFLVNVSRTDRWRVMLDPRALFSRHGTLSLFDNRIVLTGWEHGEPVTVYAREVVAIGISPPVAGLRPIMLRHDNGETLYLMINHRRFPSRDDNTRWSVLLADWLDAAR